MAGRRGHNGPPRIYVSKLKPLRIWVISEIYYPEDTSTGHYITQIAEALATAHEVQVICGLPNYAKRGVRLPATELHHGVRITRCRSTTLNRNRVALRLINVATSTLALFFCALRKLRRGDAVLVGTNPPTLSFFVALVARLRGCRLVLRLDDVYPDAMVRAGLVAEGGVWSRIHDLLNRWLYASCERIVAVGRDMAELVRKKAGSSKVSVIFIPNWGDVDVIYPRPRSEIALRSELHLAAKLVLGYAGNMGPLQGIEHLARCAENLRAMGEVHFLLIGSGKMSAWLEHEVRARGLSNVTLAGQLPRERQNEFLNAFDVGIVSLVKNMRGVGVPSRSYNIMAAGKPIVAVVDDDSEIARMVREERIGWVVPPGDVEAFRSAVTAAAADSERLRDMGRRARVAAEARYSQAVITRSYLSLFP